jgi:hypothetical protein
VSVEVVDASTKAMRLKFAEFLDKLAASSVHDKEQWLTFVVEHYLDDKLEAIRRDLGRLSIKRGRVTQWTQEDRSQIESWARQLRESH